MNEKILSTIAKLLNHAESAKEIGSAKEAEAFAVQARQLMLQHKIEMHDIQAAIGGDTHEEEVEQACIHPSEWGEEWKAKRSWKGRLAAVLAPSYFCEVLVFVGSNKITVIGSEQDRELFVSSLAGMIAAAEALCDADYKRFLNAGNARVRIWRQSWLSGFISGVRDKIKAEKAREQKETNTTGLMVIRDQMKRVEAKTASLRTGTVHTRQQQHDSARDRGYQAGREGHAKRIGR